MPFTTRQCVVCKKIEAISKKFYFLICSNESENKLRMGYPAYARAKRPDLPDLPEASLIGSYVHKACYGRITRELPSVKRNKRRILKRLNYSMDICNVSTAELNFDVGSSETDVEEIASRSMLPPDCIDLEEDTRDNYSETNTRFTSYRTPNGSSITFIRNEEPLNSDLNVCLMASELNCDTSESFCFDSFPVMDTTKEQENDDNEEKINQENSSHQSIIIEDQVNMVIRQEDVIQHESSTNEKGDQIVRSDVLNLKRQRRSPSKRIANRVLTLPSSNMKNLILFPENDIQSTHKYDNAFEELSSWLINLLATGLIIPMTDIKIYYEKICLRRGESNSSCRLRASAIRTRLHLKFGDDLIFYHRSKREGLYVALNDLPLILEKSVSVALTEDKNLRNNSAQMGHKRTEHTQCESVFDAIQLLRDSIQQYSHYFTMLQKNRSSLIDFNSHMFWNCIPMLLKNFIGMLTLSNRRFNEMRKNYDFYSLLHNDMFVNDEKQLKIACISYDLINATNQRFITPKHYLLANELFRHERSAQLLTITNRMGHTCSYRTMSRLQYEAAEKAKIMSNELDRIQRRSGRIISHEFAVKVADNFDMNKETLHGENSIHILNQIIVKTPENDEIFCSSNDVLNDIINQILTLNSLPTVPMQIVSSKSVFNYEPFIDHSFDSCLFAYCLSKYISSMNFDAKCFLPRSMDFPLLSGYFAVHLTPQKRPNHSISFCTPIKESPNDIATTETCLRETKNDIIDSNYQRQAVLVVDEKLYQNCIKVIRCNPTEYQNVFIYPGDFHLMKTTMIMIWQILDGSGFDDILSIIYKGATLRSILNVHSFNKSFRCCKLLYTALSMLFIDSYMKSFITTTISASNSSPLYDKFHVIFKNIPNECCTDSIKQIWFKDLVAIIEKEDILSKISVWAENVAKQSQSFKYWYFVLHHLLEPLIILYSSIRTSNFNARNACVSRLGPLFFSTNHRNYARLCALHLFDLSTASSYLLERLSKSFAVVRSKRPFSSIALDQTIESSINKHGKSHGGISGKFSDTTIDVWTNSFAYRAVLTSILHEICEIETDENGADSHIECTALRQKSDNQELNILLLKLKEEEIFSSTTDQFRKLLSGKIIHGDIIDNITTSFVRGEEAMSTYIKDRLINKTVKIEEPLKAMHRLKLSDADTYVPGQQVKSKKNSLLNLKSKDLTKIFNSVDKLMHNTLIIAEQRNLSLSCIFSHEFTPAPLSLCDLRNCTIMNQQKKCSAIDFIKGEFPAWFSLSSPSICGMQALIIDGGSILEIKPAGRAVTVRQYAQQLLNMVICYNFHQYDRIDVVFDSKKSKDEKSFISRHANNKKSPLYDLKCDDILDSDHHKLIHSNRAMVAARIKECWSTRTCIETLPAGKILVIAGPDDTAITLQKCNDPFEDYLLMSNHVEADTRLFLHAQAISFENIRSITIEANDTDVIILAIAHVLFLDVDNVFVKSFNTRAKLYTYINTRQLALAVKQKFGIDPMLLIVIHALSGCDTTSFIKNISKPNIFRTFLYNSHRYLNLKLFFSLPLSVEAISTAERLLLDCYSFTNPVPSLDALRATMASSAFKQNRSSFVSPTLPPSNNAFYHHCQRVARQIQIWHQVYEPDMIIGSMESCEGYVAVGSEIQLKWLSIGYLPSNPHLSVCGKCLSHCQRCSCGKKGIVCTLLCKCSKRKCQNRNNSSQVPDLNQIYADDVDFDSNLSTNICELDESNLVETEDEDLSHHTDSFASNNTSNAESDNCEFSQLYRSSYHSMSSFTDDDDGIENNSLAATRIEHNYDKRSFVQQNNKTSVSQHKRRKFLHKSLSELEVNDESNMKPSVQSQNVNSLHVSSETIFKIPLSPISFSQPTTSTPRVPLLSKNNSQRTIKKNRSINDENSLPKLLLRY